MIRRDIWDGNWDSIGQFKDRLMELSLQDRADTIYYFLALDFHELKHGVKLRRELRPILSGLCDFVVGNEKRGIKPEWDRTEVDEWKATQEHP